MPVPGQSMTNLPFATLILGPHRSGTSCVAELVHGLGHEVGRDLLDAHECNVRGLWENAAVVEFDERLLAAAGSAWFDHSFADLQDLSIDYAEHQEAVGKLLAVQFARTHDGPVRNVVVKDPRMCRAAPLFVSAFTALGYQVRSLIVLRDPRECAESLYRRDGILHAVGVALWVSHMLGVLRAVQRGEAKVIPYADLMKDDGLVIKDVAEWLDAGMMLDEAGLRNLGSRIDPGLRHHRTDPDGRGEESLAPIEALADEIFASLYNHRDAQVGSVCLEEWVRRYRSTLSESRWLGRQAVMVRYLQANAAQSGLPLLAGLNECSVAGSLYVRDGVEDGMLPPMLSEMAATGQVGLFLNMSERGEGASLVRGIGLTGGKDALLLRSAAQGWFPWLNEWLARAAVPVAPVLFVAPDDCCAATGTPLARDVLAIYIPGEVIRTFDCWEFVPRGDDAWTLLIEYLLQGRSRADMRVLGAGL
jgi:hypothetical protein